MQASANIISRLKKEEGFRAKAYKDDFGGTARIEYSIGYGHQIGINESHLMSATLTEKQASDLLLKDLAAYEKPINNALKKPISQNQFDALLSFAYNVGSVPSSISNLINAGSDSTAVANKMKQYVFWRGNPNKEAAAKPYPPLVARRNYEAGLFMSGVISNIATAINTTIADASVKKKA